MLVLLLRQASFPRRSSEVQTYSGGLAMPTFPSELASFDTREQRPEQREGERRSRRR